MLLWNGVARAEMLSTDQDVIPARPNGWVDGGVYKRMHQHKWTSEDEIPLQSWVRTYDGINACNRVLYQIESGQIQLGDRETTIISELKVLRASYYYLLDDLFGNVPIITKFDVPAGYLPEQSTRKEVYEFIIQELTENIPNLSEEVNSEYYGRFNKWAGYTLLAKMYLNSEVFSDGAHKDYDKCIEACNKVLECGKYSMETVRKMCSLHIMRTARRLYLHFLSMRLMSLTGMHSISTCTVYNQRIKRHIISRLLLGVAYVYFLNILNRSILMISA